MNLRSILIAGLFSFFLISPARMGAQEPVKASEQLDFVQGLLSRGMYDMAILQCRKFIADYPHSTFLQEAYLSLGEGYFLSQDFKKAVDTFNQFNQLYPHSERLWLSLLRLGQIGIQQKKYDEALKELTSIDAQKQLKGTMLQSFDFYTAQAYLGKADTASALDYFQKAAQVQGASSATAAYALKEAGKIDTQNGHYSEAMDAYAKSMPLAQDDSLKGELTYRTAEAKFLSGQYADAIKGFGQVLDWYPAALSLIELKEYDQANALLNRALAFPTLKSQERAKIFIKKADILIREGKYKDGLALLDAYSSENINDADETFFLKAQGHYGLGDFDRAFILFENVYLNFPGSRFSKAALLGQAHARRQTGRFKESEILFLKYYNIQNDPDLKSDALYDAVMIAVKAGDVSGTISNVQEYLKAFPGQRPNWAYFLLGFNQQLLGNSDQALKAYAQVDPHQENGEFYPGALKNMAIIYLSQENDDQARACFDRLISQADQNDLQIKTYIWVCNEYLKEQEFDDVLRIAAQAEKYFPLKDLLEIKYFKAEALRGQGSCEEAVKDYDLVTSSTQKNAYTGRAHIGDGLCLAGFKKFDLAKQEFQKSLDENADDSTVTMRARFEIANLEASQGNFNEALKFYLLVAAIYDEDYYCSESLLRAAKISERLQRKADALKMYSEILDKYKNSTAALYAKGRVRLLK
jgi:tetratricopeptide (TPR) repeat protein